MKKENLGLELIQSRLEGVTEIWVEVECEDGYATEVTAKVKIDISKNCEASIEGKKRLLKKVRKYVSMGKAMVTLTGIGESVYDKRELYRITNRWYGEIDFRPLKDNQYAVHYTETVDTPLKSTNAIMKAVEMVFEHVKEVQKES